MSLAVGFEPYACVLPLIDPSGECSRTGAIRRAETTLFAIAISSRLYNSSDLASDYDVFIELRAMRGQVDL